jgi:hypothetical protein
MLCHNADGTTTALGVGGRSAFIGATPSTVWLGGQQSENKSQVLPSIDRHH